MSFNVHLIKKQMTMSTTPETISTTTPETISTTTPETMTTTPETMTTTPETHTEEITQNWRAKVFLPDSFSEECQHFLDKHAHKGVLSTTGNFRLKESVGECVPYELCPPRVKRMMQKITDDGDLKRTTFKSVREYRTALINLHIYGYLHELKDKTLMQKRRVQSEYLKKWGRDNSAVVKGYSDNAKKYRSKWRNEVDLLKSI
jgi:hypothetical protein